MNARSRILAAVGATVLVFLAVQLGALALVEPFVDAEYQVVEDPDDPTNSLLYLGIIIIATGFILLTFRYNVEWLIRALMIVVCTVLSWYVFAVIIPIAVLVGSVDILSLGLALAVGFGLLVYPEWYVINIAGIVVGAGAAGMFGISFGLLPALLLLTVLAVYDAISVYKTKHMLSLADGVMDLKLPVIFVIPTSLSYSYLEMGSTDGVIEGAQSADGGSKESETESESESTVETEAASKAGPDPDRAPTTDSDKPDSETDSLPERDALFIGLGDAVIPTILVASAAFFIDAGTISVPLIALNGPALGAMIGTLAGLLVLMYMVLQGRAHAGLPLLNGGAISGYLLGALASGVPLLVALGL